MHARSCPLLPHVCLPRSGLTCDSRFAIIIRVTEPLKGFGGAGVLELIEEHDRGTYRAVYTVKFPGVVYVLHVFQKKSKRGVATPRHDIELIRSRYELAQDHNRTIEQHEEDRHA